MAEYDFSTLNSTDLENLVCDLLNSEQPKANGIVYRTFKDGKDKGIDFLYSTTINPYEHVGQVKHFYRTGYDGLFSVLKNHEVAKVKILKPSKYILATSVDLSVSNIEAINKIFKPYIKNLYDIYGKKDLNRLLETHSEILNNHYKLWFSDTTVLQKILNSDLEFRSSAFVEHELKRRLRIYVKTSLFEKARNFLRKNKFIIITGEPGVGKTSLAEMLVYEYILQDYHLTYILDDIKEAEKVLTPDDKKQIIYFDDFLGSNAVEINKAKGSETNLRRILRRVASMENKLFVFTTRTFLLNTAISESENLRKFNIKAKESILKLTEYNKDIKKQLLNNHIEDCELREDLKSILNSKEIQDFILDHENFSPRSIEFITTKEIVNDFTGSEFKEFILSNFNSPSDIWEHAYSQQIKEDDRLLLNTLLSFGEWTTIEELERAFHSRLDLEIKTNNKRKEISAFKKTFQRLEGGFIILKNGNEVHFINPSLIDFLLSYIRLDEDEVTRIAESICFTSQLTERLFSLSSSKENIIPARLEKKLLEDYATFVTKENEGLDLIRLALVIHKYIKSKKSEDIVCEILNEIDDWESLYNDYSLNSHFRKFMDSARGNYRINKIIEDRIVEILTELVLGEDDINKALEVIEDLVKKYDISINLSSDTTRLNEHMDQLLEDYIDQEISWLKDYITNEDEADSKRREIEDIIDRLKKTGLSIEQNSGAFYHVDWYEVAMDNEFRRQMEKGDYLS